MSEVVIELFRYNAWANDRLFAACAELSDAQLNASADGVYGTIRDTLVHIAAAQGRLTAALAESEPNNPLRERDPFPGIPRLREHLLASSELLVELAVNARDGATVTTNDREQRYTLPAWLLFVQAIQHATEHRTQIAAILTQLGIEPPGMDGWAYHEDVFAGDWSQLWSS